VALFVGGLVVLALRTTTPPRRTGIDPDGIPTVSPFMGHYVPVTRKHGPGAEPFPGGHAEYLKGRVYPTVAAALKDPRLREDNCRILLLDEVHEDQEAIDGTVLPQGIAIESARTNPPTVWLPPARADASRPLLLVLGGTRLAVRNLTFHGQDKLDTLVAWNEPGPGCQLHDVRITGFNRHGATLRNPAGEAKDPVQLSRVRVHPSTNTTVETGVLITATGPAPARHVRLTECRLEGPATQGLWARGGIEGLEMTRCRLFGLSNGARFTGPGALQATLTFNTTFKVQNPVWLDTFASFREKDDRVVLRSNLFADTTASAVRFTSATPTVELFRGSEANWCGPGGCQPEVPGVPVSESTDPVVLRGIDPTRDNTFLRYPPNSSLATAGPGKQPVGVPP
jgi:hypothetical protein